MARGATAHDLGLGHEVIVGRTENVYGSEQWFAKCLQPGCPFGVQIHSIHSGAEEYRRQHQIATTP